jgi:hypothetical protein
LQSTVREAVQVDRSGGVVTVIPVDIGTAPGLSALRSSLLVGTVVKAFGVPQPDHSLSAYVLFYYTGAAPST